MKIEEIIIKIFNLIKNIPFYWVGLFTSVLLLILSILAIDSIPNNNLTFFGGENGAIGIALAQGRGFSDPFLTGSGATAWVSPLLPAILSIIFYAANYDLVMAYWISLFIKILSLGFGISLIWDVLQKCTKGYAGICYIWMVVLCYFNRELLIYNFHDEWLVFLIISLAFWAWYKRAEFIGQIFMIVSSSLSALTSPILWLALFIVILIFNYDNIRNFFNKDRVKKKIKLFNHNLLWIAVTVSFFIIIGWTFRNWVHLGILAPVKSNAGYEIYQAQIVSKNGVLTTSTFIEHPHNYASEKNKAYKEMGEAEFVSFHREIALRSIANHPGDYMQRIAQRLSNAFLFTVLHFDFCDVDKKISNDDLKKLKDAGLVKYYFNRKVWINLNDLDRKDISRLQSLDLVNPELVERNYRSTLINYYQYVHSYDRIIAGMLIGGMPWLALFLAILMRQYSELNHYVSWASIFIILYLLPYVIISHYLRYQVPLFGMQAVLLTSGTVAIVRAIKERLNI